MEEQISRGKECISVIQRTDSRESSLMTKPHFVLVESCFWTWLCSCWGQSSGHCLRLVSQNNYTSIQLIVFGNCEPLCDNVGIIEIHSHYLLNYARKQGRKIPSCKISLNLYLITYAVCENTENIPFSSHYFPAYHCFCVLLAKYSVIVGAWSTTGTAVPSDAKKIGTLIQVEASNVTVSMSWKGL